MEIIIKLAATFALLGVLVLILGIVCGAATGFTDNWALKIAAVGFGMMLSAVALGVIFLLTQLWL